MNSMLALNTESNNNSTKWRAQKEGAAKFEEGSLLNGEDEGKRMRTSYLAGTTWLEDKEITNDFLKLRERRKVKPKGKEKK